ncbi:MAG: D-alanyl-D-alanine carboxypeptidase family protein [Lachnospiraceae bacterium]
MIGKKIVLTAITCLLLGNPYLPVSKNPELFAQKLQEEMETTIKENELYARSAVLMDASSGRVLYEKNGEEQMPMASTTKIMTCILALENGNLDDVMEVSSYAASMPKVHLGVKTGEHYLLKDLLYSLMLESHNDSAVVIAEHIGGSAEGFADMMNQKARDIGCFDTYFITPNGLDASAVLRDQDGNTRVQEHATTAEDLARIMSYCILYSPKKEEFLEITRTAGYCFSNMEKDEAGEWKLGGRTFSCTNHNAFLDMMPGALSGKTGFTGNAGYCYVGALEDDGRIYTVSLLACGWPSNKGYKWQDTRKLMEYGVEQYTYHAFSELPIEENLLEPLSVKDGQTERLGGQAQVSLYMEEAEAEQKQPASEKQAEELKGLLVKRDEQIEMSCQVAGELSAPVEKGETVGSIRYIIDGTVWKSVSIKTAERVEAIDFTWCMNQIGDRFLMFCQPRK